MSGQSSPVEPHLAVSGVKPVRKKKTKNKKIIGGTKYDSRHLNSLLSGRFQYNFNTNQI